MTLIEALAKFNRKERYWLIQQVLGKPCLSYDFRRDVICELRKTDKEILDIPSNAYWAIDYHFDWIAGAIATLNDKEKVKIKNDPFDKKDNEVRLIGGNQEDSDLLIAYGNTLILVECKAGGDWGNQICSKKKRIECLKRFLKEFKSFEVKIYFVILCPKNKRQKDKCDVPWLPLKCYAEEKFDKVERCDADENADANGNFWHIVPVN